MKNVRPLNEWIQTAFSVIVVWVNKLWCFFELRRDDSVKYPAQSNETSNLTQKNGNDANNENETMQIANAA